LAEKILAHVIFWVVILILSSPLWLPRSCTEACCEARPVKQVKIGGAMVIAEVRE
jgi:hypothetical protein